MDARDHRRLVETHAEPVAELQPEARLLVGEAKLLRRRPNGCDVVRRRARSHEVDRVVEPFAALPVRIELRLGDAGDVERAVIARSIAHERVDDVEECLVARPEEAIGKYVRMRVAPLTRYSIDRLDLLRAELEQELHRIEQYEQRLSSVADEESV